MAFPSSPSNGQIVTRFGRKYQYNQDTGQWRGVQAVATTTIADIVDEEYIAARITASGTGVTTYSTFAELPLADITTGAQAFVEESNRLYLWNGAGWYNIALINTAPSITSGAAASYSKNILSSDTIITLAASDPEGFPLTYNYSITSGSLVDTTVTQNNNVFTISPGATATSFGISFTASDGVNISASSSTFNIINNAPVINTASEASYILDNTGTPTVITLEATDPEGQPITWSYNLTSGSLGNTVISQTNNVFTITPSTDENDAGQFSIAFIASDGVNNVTSTSAFTLAFAVPTEILLVGGGGAGGNGWATGGGGGGGGGVIHDTSAILSPNTTYPIVVGLGAAGFATTDAFSEYVGQSTTAFGYTALGGGSGGQFDSIGRDGLTRTGGSGGGGNGNGATINGAIYNNAIQQASAGTPSSFPAGNTTAVSYQTAGGNGVQDPDYNSRHGGGGGGAGTPGSPGTTAGTGSGGNGIPISITGSSVYYAGGGAGAKRNAGPGTLGTGGLGGGGNVNNPGTNGLGGGGGGNGDTRSVTPASGGSGVVIIRTLATATATTGNPTITTNGAYNIYKFLTNGSITF